MRLKSKYWKGWAKIMELIINELANKDHLTNDRQYNAGLKLIGENGYASVSSNPDVRYYLHV